MNRWTSVVLLILVAGVGAVVYQVTTTSTPVRMARVVQGDIREYVIERGKTRLSHTYDITMPFAGRVEKNDLEAGDRVAVGEVVARVVAFDLENEVDEAQAVVERLQAAIEENNDTAVERRAREQMEEFVKSMIHTVAAAAARKTAGSKRLAYSETYLQRTRELQTRSAKTIEDVELAELQNVERQVDFQQDDLVWKSMQSVLAATQLLPEIIDAYIARKSLTAAVLRKQKAEADARLRQILKRRDRGTMVSPIDGVVLANTVDDEQFVQAGAVLLRIGRLEDLEVEVDVLSRDATRIRPGAEVDIFGLAAEMGMDQHIKGIVYRTSPQAHTKISSLGVEQQRVRVLVRMPESAVTQLRQLGVGADYRVRVRIYTAARSDVPIVPRPVLFRGSDGQWQTFVVRDGCAKLQTVGVGLINDELVEITSGLQKDDSVVVSPDNTLVDGTRVKEAV